MSDENQSRENIRRRIRSSSRDAVIREEMIRLGFWRPEDGEARLSDDWIERRAELSKEIRALTAKQRKFEDRKAMLREMRKRRMAEARQRREETKQRREEERKARAADWNEKKAKDITYLGDGVSKGLNSGEEGELDRLLRLGLPKITTVEELARYFETSVSELRFLAFNRKVSQTTHYRRFYLNKKSGGQRLISAPMPRLKEVQYQVLNRILYRVKVHEAVHGFAPERSILTNAQQHVGKDVVINLDLRDFFPTVTYPRVKGVYRNLGFGEKIATILALICTEPDADEVELDGERYFIHTSERHLPQGAPTSPALTNILCYRLDKRLFGMAGKLGFAYTRYADDITFSASGEAADHLRKLLWRARSIVTDEGFTVHPDKTRIMRKSARQEVTGLVVNEGVSVPRRDLRSFRALLHQIEKDGIEGKSWRGSEAHLLAAIRGYAYFVRMVDPSRGQRLVNQTTMILHREGWSHEIRHPRKPTASEREGKAGKPGRSLIDRLKFWKR